MSEQKPTLDLHFEEATPTNGYKISFTTSLQTDQYYPHWYRRDPQKTTFVSASSYYVPSILDIGLFLKLKLIDSHTHKPIISRIFGPVRCHSLLLQKFSELHKFKGLRIPINLISAETITDEKVEEIGFVKSGTKAKVTVKINSLKVCTSDNKTVTKTKDLDAVEVVLDGKSSTSFSMKIDSHTLIPSSKISSKSVGSTGNQIDNISVKDEKKKLKKKETTALKCQTHTILDRDLFLGTMGLLSLCETPDKLGGLSSGKGKIGGFTKSSTKRTGTHIIHLMGKAISRLNARLVAGNVKRLYREGLGDTKNTLKIYSKEKEIEVIEDDQKKNLEKEVGSLEIDVKGEEEEFNVETRERGITSEFFDINDQYEK